MTKREVKLKIVELAATIAEVLFKGYDVELRRSENGIRVIALKKEVVVK